MSTESITDRVASLRDRFPSDLAATFLFRFVFVGASLAVTMFFLLPRPELAFIGLLAGVLGAFVVIWTLIADAIQGVVLA